MKVFLIFAFAVASQATIYYFNNSSPTPRLWSNSACWIPKGVPGANDTAVLDHVTNVEYIVSKNSSVENVTLVRAQLRIVVVANDPTITIGDFLVLSDSTLDITSSPAAQPLSKLTITNSLTLSDSTLLLSNTLRGGDFSGATLNVSGESTIRFSNNGFIAGFKSPVQFPSTAVFTCSAMPQGLTWRGQLSGTLRHCALLDSDITAVGDVSLSSVVVNNTKINAQGFTVTVLPPIESDLQETHLTDGSSIIADEVIFFYPYNTITPSRDTYINCDRDCKAALTVQNVTLDGYANLGYTIRIAVCLTVGNTVRVSERLYGNLTALIKPFIHFVQGSQIANVDPIHFGDGRSYTVLVGGEYRRNVSMCQNSNGNFIMKDRSGNLDLQLQENAVLDNVNLNGTLTISNTITKEPASVVIKNGGQVQSLKIGHGTLTFDDSTSLFNVVGDLRVEHPADYQMRQSILSVATITGNPQIVLNPGKGTYLSAPVGRNREAVSQMRLVINVDFKSFHGDMVTLYLDNARMKVDVLFSKPVPMFAILPSRSPGRADSIVDLSLTAGPQSFVNASALKLNAGGFDPKSLLSLNLGNGSTYVAAQWRMPTLVVNGKLTVLGGSQESLTADLVTANTVASDLPELTTNIGLVTVNNFSSASNAGWWANSNVTINGFIQGGAVLTIEGSRSTNHVQVTLLDGPLQNLVLSGVSFTHFTNPTAVNGSVAFINSTYANDSGSAPHLTTTFILNSGASWEISNVTHAAEYLVSIPTNQDLCLDERIGDTTESCVGTQVAVPRKVRSAKFTCVAPPPPFNRTRRTFEIVLITAGICVAIALLVGIAVYHIRRKNRLGYSSVESERF